MTADGLLSAEQLDRVRAAAGVLLPGSAESPAPQASPDFDQLLEHAAGALEGEGRALEAAIDGLGPDVTWETLAAFADRDPSSFEQVSLLAVGAYFMSSTVLASLGVPPGQRRPANPEQVVDELDSGILDAVFNRGCPVRTLDDVNGAAHAG